MGILDKILGRKEPPEKKPDFSGVRTGGGSTLGEKPATPYAPDAPARPATEGAGGASRTYEVQQGDSLSKIAQRFYGNAHEWPKIHQANRDQIKDPDLIYPGQKLVIP